MKLHNISINKGFTLFEVLIVLGLFVVLVSFGLFVSMDFYRGSSFRSERNTVVSILTKARNQSLNNVNEAPHGVFFPAGAYVLFQGPSYASRTTAFDETITATPTVTRSGLSEIVFSQLSGNANVSGSIFMSNGTRTSTVLINYEGRMDW